MLVTNFWGHDLMGLRVYIVKPYKVTVQILPRKRHNRRWVKKYKKTNRVRYELRTPIPDGQIVGPKNPTSSNDPYYMTQATYDALTREMEKLNGKRTSTDT